MLIYYHGGGHVSGSFKAYNRVYRQIAHQANCAVVAVEHRLAPENKFPRGINDCLAAFDAVVEHADVLGFDPMRVSVGGDSAGGNASAVVAQQRKDASCPPKFQILWVPWLDMSKQTPSYESMAEGFLLEKGKMEWYTAQYLEKADHGLDPLASPMLGDVTGVCPAALLVAGFDPLRDEAVAYGDKLSEAGVKTHTKVYESMIHMFVNFAGKFPGARVAFDDAIQLLKENM